MLWMIPLAAAAAGALLDKKQPMRGALMGGAIGATGGAAAGGLLGAGAAGAGAAGAAGGAAGGAGLTAGAGLAGASGTAGAASAGMGGGTGLLASSGAGLSGSIPVSSGLLGTATGSASQVAAASTPSLLAQAKPYMDAAGVGMSVAGAMNKDEPPTPPPAVAQNMPNNNLGQLVAGADQAKQSEMASVQQARAMRKQKLRGVL